MECGTEIIAATECPAYLGAGSLQQNSGNKNDGQNNLDIGEEGLHWPYTSISGLLLQMSWRIKFSIT